MQRGTPCVTIKVMMRCFQSFNSHLLLSLICRCCDNICCLLWIQKTVSGGRMFVLGGGLGWRETIALLSLTLAGSHDLWGRALPPRQSQADSINNPSGYLNEIIKFFTLSNRPLQMAPTSTPHLSNMGFMEQLRLSCEPFLHIFWFSGVASRLLWSHRAHTRNATRRPWRRRRIQSLGKNSPIT